MPWHVHRTVRRRKQQEEMHIRNPDPCGHRHEIVVTETNSEAVLIPPPMLHCDSRPKPSPVSVTLTPPRMLTRDGCTESSRSGSENVKGIELATSTPASKSLPCIVITVVAPAAADEGLIISTVGAPVYRKCACPSLKSAPGVETRTTVTPSCVAAGKRTRMDPSSTTGVSASV
eukprot:1624366-Rhodomonas_salina.1